MAINMFKVKRWGATILSSMLPVILFYIGLISYGFIGGMIFLLVSIILVIPLTGLLLRNPFSQMVEGKGILTMNIDSTGIMAPFLVGVQAPYIRGMFNKTPVNDIFDREAVWHMAHPVKSTKNGQPITKEMCEKVMERWEKEKNPGSKIENRIIHRKKY